MLIKKKSLIVALVSGLIICGVLVLTLVGYLVYLELKDKELRNSYQQLLQKVNAKLYSRHIAISGLGAATESTGSLKGDPVIEGTLTNNGYREISDILLLVKFLDNDGAVLYEVVFHPQEPSLGHAGITQAALPHLQGAPKAAIKKGSTLAFKKILAHCPAGILSEIKRPGGPAKGRGRWSGKLHAEILSVSF
jgi:hypothetical protein